MMETYVHAERKLITRSAPFVYLLLLICLAACVPEVKTVLPPGHHTGIPRGVLDVSIAFPGEGIFSSYDASVLPVTKVCGGNSIFGSSGTAVCQNEAPAGVETVASQVLTGTYFWDSLGYSRQGTMANRAGTWDLTTAFPGTGYYTGISSAISASDVCNTKNILGSAGTAVCNSTVSDLHASHAIRSDYATVDLTVSAQVDARSRAVWTDEAAGNATYTANHNLVPNPKYDTDGQGDDTGIGTALRSYLVTVKGRPDKVCGLSGSVATRISDCLTQNAGKSSWEGKKYGQSGEGDWKLVTLYKAAAISGDACAGGSAAGCFEVWRDERTQLLWSDYLNNNGNGYNWFRAAGYSSSATTVASTGKEGRAGVGTDCTDSGSAAEVCQPATPISVCAPSASIAGLNGIANYQNPDGTAGTYNEEPAKGNISGASALWRLPTYGDWATAYANGVHKVIPNMTGTNVFWTATSYSTNRNQVWVAGWSGLLSPGDRGQVYGVRCVGH